MANTFKQVIPTANRKKTNKSFDFTNITTAGFMQIQPIAIREVVPNQTLDITLESFCRPNPLLKPTFGRARINNRLFFVPFRTIFPRFTQFIESEPIFSLVDNQYGLQTSVPVVRNSDLVDTIFADAAPCTATDPYDLSYLDTSNVVHYFYLGPVGLNLLTVLTALGYKPNYNLKDTETFSALPLLAYAKIIVDWYYPSQYINSTVISSLTPYFEQDSLSPVIIPATIIWLIATLFNECAYNDSLLVDAWDRPVAPNTGVESQYKIPDLTFSGTDVVDGLINQGGSVLNDASVANTMDNGTPYGKMTDRNLVPLAGTVTEYQHSMLKALTDFTQRHRLSGVRAVDRYLSEYGINLSSEIMRRSILLGSDTYDLQFGDVMSHSDTTGANLGDYAGKGIGYGSNKFSYNIGNEFGFLIMINTVIPEVGYYQGINRICKHKSILDFYHADYDGLGVQAVAADEVYVHGDGGYSPYFSLPNIHSKVFGFVPRYAEYKTAPSILNGLFAVTKTNTDLFAFHLMRDLSGQFSGITDISHDVGFVMGGDSVQYNRIFYNQGKAGDNIHNFNFIHHFSINQTDETAPLYDTYDFKEVRKVVEVHTQSAKVN